MLLKVRPEPGNFEESWNRLPQKKKKHSPWCGNLRQCGKIPYTIPNRTHGPRTPKKPEYQLIATYATHWTKVRWDSVPCNFWWTQSLTSQPFGHLKKHYVHINLQRCHTFAPHWTQRKTQSAPSKKHLQLEGLKPPKRLKKKTSCPNSGALTLGGSSQDL